MCYVLWFVVFGLNKLEPTLTKGIIQVTVKVAFLLNEDNKGNVINKVY